MRRARASFEAEIAALETRRQRILTELAAVDAKLAHARRAKADRAPDEMSRTARATTCSACGRAFARRRGKPDPCRWCGALLGESEPREETAYLRSFRARAERTARNAARALDDHSEGGERG